MCDGQADQGERTEQSNWAVGSVCPQYLVFTYTLHMPSTQVGKSCPLVSSYRARGGCSQIQVSSLGKSRFQIPKMSNPTKRNVGYLPESLYPLLNLRLNYADPEKMANKFFGELNRDICFEHYNQSQIKVQILASVDSISLPVQPQTPRLNLFELPQHSATTLGTEPRPPATASQQEPLTEEQQMLCDDLWELYNDMEKSNKPAPENMSRFREFFQRYASTKVHTASTSFATLVGKPCELIDGEGIRRLAADLGVALNDVSILVMVFLMHPHEMGFIAEEEFARGMCALG